MADRQRLLFISNLFPNPLSPNMASFNRQQIEALSRYVDIDVVAPVPWQEKLQKRPFPAMGRVGSVESWHPTYFYTPGSFRSFYGNFYLRSIAGCVKELVRRHRYAGIYGSWLFPDGWASARLAEELNLPLFLKVHGTDVNRLGNGNQVSRRSLWAVSKACKVFCVSRALRDKLLELGAEADRLEVVYNGVDFGTFFHVAMARARERLGIDHAGPLLLYVGNLKAAKGLGELANAFAQLRKSPEGGGARLAIVGGGDFGTELRQRLGQLGVMEHVSFIGSLPLDQVALWMNAADLLCLPSYNEGVPNVVLESLSCGCPVVATAVGGTPELLGPGRHLTLVPPRNVEALVGAILAALTHRQQPKSTVDQPVASWDDNAKAIYSMMKDWL